MRYTPEIYATALNQVLKEDMHNADELLKRFKETLQKNGDANGAEKIIEAFKRIKVQEEGGKFIRVEVARKEALGNARSFAKFASKKDLIDYKINPRLVAGTRIQIDSELELDNSFERKVRKLFQNK
ncbi:F0F1 ATP synthase subunit delta [Candidatus Giovannonibacteria bacterium]|nr:F0F1 ATP synthase subunit delta [Candidatus Giovannonibacteria bacterium]